MTFYETISAAIRDFETNGFDSQERLNLWLEKIRAAALDSLVPEWMLQREITNALQTIYKRLIDNGGIAKIHPGIARFGIDKLKPQLRAELDRRVMTSAQLIKLNRQAMIERTTQRFAGWASSIPAGGSNVIDVKDVKSNIRKALVSLPFDERRVMVDQGHKFTSALSDIIALDNNAIAAEWHSHYRQAGYNYRPDHKERDGRIYAIRGNWAMDKGYMRAGPDGYTDEITRPAEEVFCRCTYRYIYALRSLPDTMLTNAGRAALNDAREYARSI